MRRLNFKKIIIFSIIIISTLSVIFLTNISYSNQAIKYPFKLDKQYIIKKTYRGLPSSNQNIKLFQLNQIDSAKNEKSYTDRLKQKEKCIETKTSPSFFICLFLREIDLFFSAKLYDTGVWEDKITDIFEKILKVYPKATFIDMGCNLGYFSLLSLKMNHLTVAIDINRESLTKFNHSLALNQLNKMAILIEGGVSNNRGKGVISDRGDNQGDTQLKQMKEDCIGSCPPQVFTFLLNDLTYLISNLTYIRELQLSDDYDDKNNSLSFNEIAHAFLKNKLQYYLNKNIKVKEDLKKNKIIIKMDIQGYEHRAFSNGDLFFERNNVICIFMEWAVMKKIRKIIKIQSNQEEYYQFQVQQLKQHQQDSKENKQSIKNSFGDEFQNDFFYKLHRIQKENEILIDNNPQITIFDQNLIENMIRFLLQRNFLPFSLGEDNLKKVLNVNIWPEWPENVIWVKQNEVYKIGGFYF